MNAISKRIETQSRAASEVAPCHAARLGRAINALAMEWHASQDRFEAAPKTPAGDALRKTADAATDEFGRQIALLRTEVSWQRAATWEGALAQIVASAGVAMNLTANVMSEDQTGEALLRALYSIRGLIERETGVKPQPAFVRHMMSDRVSPFVNFDERALGGAA